MAKGAGRKTVIKKAGTVIAGVRTTSFSVDNTPIDVTDNDSAGVQELLDVAGSRVLSLTVSGVESDQVLRNLALQAGETSAFITDLTFVFGNQAAATDTLTCNWFMSNYKDEGDYQGAQSFSATFTSSGTWTRT